MTTKRNRRSGVEDRWRKTIRVGDVEQKVPSANDGKGKRWRARYVDDLGTEHAKGFDRKVDAQNWLNTATTALGTGTHVAPPQCSDHCSAMVRSVDPGIRSPS